MGSLFNHVIRQFVRVLARLRKVAGQFLTDFLNRFYQRITKLLILKMRPHFFHNAVPELITAFFMNPVVANNREFVNTRRDKNQHRIVLARFMQSEPVKLLPRRDEGITVQLPPLD